MTYSRAIAAMHLSALLWGLTGVLGAMTSLDSSILTVGRSIFALVAVTSWFGFGAVKAALHLRRGLQFRVVLGGFLLGLHWIFFFLSVAKGGVAIALVTYAAGAGFIAGAEVLLGWTKPKLASLIAPGLSFAGIYVMVPFTDLQSVLNNQGLVYGMISSFLLCVLAINGKSLMSRNGVAPLAITTGQLLGAIIIGSPVALAYLPQAFTLKDLAILILLGAFCSAVGQTLYNRALQTVPAGTGAVIANMEAPYGVVLAALLVAQPITGEVAVGVVLVTLSSLVAGFNSDETINE